MAGKEKKAAQGKAKEWQVEWLEINSLNPYENNARKNDATIPYLKNSIQRFGFRVPLVIGKGNVVVCGHTRLKAALELGMEKLPCVRADDLTDAELKAFRLADNKVQELSGWDFEKLDAEMKQLKIDFDGDMVDFGFDEGWGEDEKEDDGTADDVPDVAEDEVKSERGKIYQLGKHRVMCGDSTSAEDVKKLVGAEDADCWLTDPPYNVAYEGSNGLTIQNDSMEDTKFREFLRNAFGCAEKAMKPGAAFYVFHADSEGYNFRGACHDVGLRVRQCLVWKKNALVLGRQDYQWIHEPCLYGWKDGEAHSWYGGRDQTTVMEFNKPKKNDVHPTMKPVDMLVYLLKNSTKRGDVVLDTFGGSGSTLIACEETGRVCRTMELDPKYCDVIRRRWAEFVHGEGCDWESLTPEIKEEK